MASAPGKSDPCEQGEAEDPKDRDVGGDDLDKGGRIWKITKCLDGRIRTRKASHQNSSAMAIHNTLTSEKALGFEVSPRKRTFESKT